MKLDMINYVAVPQNFTIMILLPHTFYYCETYMLGRKQPIRNTHLEGIPSKNQTGRFCFIFSDLFLGCTVWPVLWHDVPASASQPHWPRAIRTLTHHTAAVRTNESIQRLQCRTKLTFSIHMVLFSSRIQPSCNPKSLKFKCKCSVLLICFVEIWVQFLTQRETIVTCSL